MGQRTSRAKRNRRNKGAGRTARERELQQRVRDLRALVSKMTEGAAARTVERLTQKERLDRLEAACRTVVERLLGVKVRLYELVEHLHGMRFEAREHKQFALMVACDGLARTALDQVNELSHVRGAIVQVAIERALGEAKAANAAPAQAGGVAVKAGETKAENYELRY